jgi:hypothetical protein
MTVPPWLTAERQIQIRNVLFGLLIFFGLVVWIFHSVAAGSARPYEFVQRLRVLGMMTWLYALVQLLDMRFYHSRFARRRIEAANVPEHMLAWLLAQMLPWYGIVYYALVGDVRWYVVGLCLAAFTTWAYPVPAGRGGLPDRLRSSPTD